MPPGLHRLRLARFVEAGLAQNHRSKGTKGEIRVAALLEAFGFNVRRNVMIGPFNVDLLVDDPLVVEVFGDYWHCNPEVYEADYFNKSLHCTAEEKWGRDRARCDWLVAAGYRVFIMWERDLKTRPDIIQLLVRGLHHEAHQ